MRALLREIQRLALRDAPVLVWGEPGTETALVAHTIHRLSPYRRRGFRFVHADEEGEPDDGSRRLPRPILVPGLPSGRGGCRLWGLTRGTLVLDEITDLRPGAQADLVRFLDRPALGPRQRRGRASIRVIATSRHDPTAAAAAGILRPGLYYHLFGSTLEVPPLRDRLRDLPALVERLRQAINRRLDRPVPRIGRNAMAALRAHHWPGNLWELEAVLTQAMVSAHGGRVRVGNLEFPSLRRDTPALPASDDTPPAGPTGLARHEREALALATARGQVRRRDLVARFSMSGEWARCVLAKLVGLGLLDRVGRGRAVRYVPRDGRRPLATLEVSRPPGPDRP